MKTHRITPLFSFLFLVCLSLGGCISRPAPEGEWQKVSFADLPDWPGSDLAQSWQAWQKNCRRLLSLPPNKDLGRGWSAADYAGACRAALDLKEPHPAAVQDFFEAHFQPFAVTGKGKFTGYFEPLYRASPILKAPYLYPLYRKPMNPFLSRAAIEREGLKGQELYYLDDPVDLFILQIQGSGQLQLPDGRKIRVGYGGDNGAPYVAIGKKMVEAGLIPAQEISLQSITAWLKAHPKEAPKWMALNPRYIFFKEGNGESAVGALGVPLSPGFSLAVDPAYVPLGAPIWLDTQWPRTKAPLRRLVLAQDKGAAIKGAIRGDLFWGTGAEGAYQAGPMNEEGRYFVLLPR